jgi:glycopeptide antibiotics resistance protein
VLLFIPPVVLTGLVFRRPALAALAGSAASALIELGQAVLPAIGRACDTGDWISNTAGAVLGALIGTTALSLARRRQNHTTGH